MYWRRLLTQVVKKEVQQQSFIALSGRYLPRAFATSGGGNGFRNVQERFQSSYVGGFARRARDADGGNHVTLLKELYRSDPEGVIRLFESQPSLHSNHSALGRVRKSFSQG